MTAVVSWICWGVMFAATLTFVVVGAYIGRLHACQGVPRAAGYAVVSALAIAFASGLAAAVI